MIRIIFILGVFFSSLSAVAQVPLRSASSNEIVERLNSAPMKTRGLRNLAPEAREKPSIDLSIQFDFDSAKILNESKPLLNNLAQAMNSNELKGFSFMIEGYTDGVGLPTYNQRLSEERANSVMSYLVNVDKVSKSRLKSIGKGAADLLLPDKPEAPENRRVRISVIE